MEDNKSKINPLRVIWQTPEVQEQLMTTGIALLSALRAGAESVQREVNASDLPKQYPYLQSAVGSIVELLGGTATPAEEQASTPTPDSANIESKSRANRKTPRATKTARKSKTTQKGSS